MSDSVSLSPGRATAGALCILLAGIFTPPARADLNAANKAYEKLLGAYVTPRGVRYDAWRSSGDDLKLISEVDMLYRSTDPAPLETNEKKALYINLYNAKVVEMVLYGNPISSIRDLSKRLNASEIFSRSAFVIDGKVLSLNGLERKLHEEFSDPRVHFALNSASKSSPPLRAEPYSATMLDTQLDDAVRRFLASPGALQVTAEGGKKTLVVSKLFDWYADDFKATGGVLAFIAKYGPQEIADAIASGKVKLEFADFDWGLNATK